MKDEHHDPREGHRSPDEGGVDAMDQPAVGRREEDSDRGSTSPEDPAFFIKDSE